MPKIKIDLPQEAYLNNPFLRLVNRQHQLRSELVFDRFKIGRQSFDKGILDNLMHLISDAERHMFKITLVCGYKSIAQQKQRYDRQIRLLKKQGLTSIEAASELLQTMPEPGASEHHTGLAVDLIDKSFLDEMGGLSAASDQLSSQQWLIANCSKYGFILRFPKDKEAQTGVAYKSWHFRFVGIENARYMQALNLSLEELITLLKKEKRDKLTIPTQYNS
ncbi:MAG: M15 family metallopeptidase [Oenococcus sp.]|uniref:M15 family metallopeptidase n=1 Tax=Oenococcus TaxID=46254 RepID=UPI0021E91B7E|nr:M15 family metallopeptidase [Oenococcus kitaharae]MCV3295858.1 M15 family metallopeptidase [Oenococcus kitaharae]